LYLKVNKINIEVSSDFINKEDCKSFIDFIDTNQKIFVGPLGRTVLQFGFDDHRKNYKDIVSGIDKINNLSIIYFNKIIKELKKFTMMIKNSILLLFGYQKECLAQG
jgi:hypothetical protein